MDGLSKSVRAVLEGRTTLLMAPETCMGLSDFTWAISRPCMSSEHFLAWHGHIGFIWTLDNFVWAQQISASPLRPSIDFLKPGVKPGVSQTWCEKGLMPGMNPLKPNMVLSYLTQTLSGLAWVPVLSYLGHRWPSISLNRPELGPIISDICHLRSGMGPLNLTWAPICAPSNFLDPAYILVWSRSNLIRTL